MRLRTSLFALGWTALATGLAACGEATPAAPCLTGGTGALTVTVTGVPAGDTAELTLTGPGGTFRFGATRTFTSLASGTYTLSAANLTVTDSLISRLVKGTPQAGSFCLRDAESRTVAVSHSTIGTSGKLWYGAGFYTLGFNASQLGSTATLPPVVTAGTRGGQGVAFDQAGNLWVRGQSSSDPALMRYAAATLSGIVNPVPDRSLGISGLSCLGPGALAFDAAGNLWMSIGCQGRVVRLTPAQYATSGTALPTVQITNLVNPQGLAFDAAGNLWVADQTQLKRFDASRLGANITGAANLAVTFTTPTPPAPGRTALQAFHLAFAPDGEFWVSSYEEQALYRVEPAVRAATGTVTATPTRIVYLNAFSAPKGFAFDNAGGLLVGWEQAKFARLSPAQLDANSTPTAPTVPQRTFASGSILGFGDDIAIFPAPPTTPLYHRAP